MKGREEGGHMAKPIYTQRSFVECRAAPRFAVMVPTRLEADPNGAFGVTRDLSQCGARLLCFDRITPGQVLELWLIARSPKQEVRATGKVVRTELFSVCGPWRYSVAVKFDQPLEQVPERFAVR